MFEPSASSIPVIMKPRESQINFSDKTNEGKIFTSRLSPYLERRVSPEPLMNDKRDEAIDLSPRAHIDSPVYENRKISVSPIKAHLLQAVHDSERYVNNLSVSDSQTMHSYSKSNNSCPQDIVKKNVIYDLKDIVPVSYNYLSSSDVSNLSHSNIANSALSHTFTVKPATLLEQHLLSVTSPNMTVHPATRSSGVPRFTLSRTDSPASLGSSFHVQIDQNLIAQQPVNNYVISPRRSRQPSNLSRTFSLQSARDTPENYALSHQLPQSSVISSTASTSHGSVNESYLPGDIFLSSAIHVPNSGKLSNPFFASSKLATSTVYSTANLNVPNKPFPHISNKSIYQMSSQTGVNEVKDYVSMLCPFNRRQDIFTKLSSGSSALRNRSKDRCVNGSMKSLDLLRQNLQKSLNNRIANVINHYIKEYFHPALENIKFNCGLESVTDEHIQLISCQILEEAKKMYDKQSRASLSPARDISDSISESGSYSGKKSHNDALKYKIRSSDSDSELSVPTKRKKGRPAISNHSGRSTPSKMIKNVDGVKREGPKWDSDRLTPLIQFVMGSRANKALGLGATRGRLYMKHPDVFKYCGDQEDKQWLYDHQYMPAAGGKAYLMIVEDIMDLAQSEEYRNSDLLQLECMVPFNVPEFMLAKMRVLMNSQRTDSTKKSGSRITPMSQRESSAPSLPFAQFMEDATKLDQDITISPANSEEMDLLSTDGRTSASPVQLTNQCNDNLLSEHSRLI